MLTHTLFAEAEKIELPDSDIVLYPALFAREQSDAFFKEFLHNSRWRQEQIKVYGKMIDLPRLTAWVGDEGLTYQYSGIVVNPQPWTPSLLRIKKEVEAVSDGVSFNSVLLNLYRTNRDSVAWHSDDEPELGRSPAIGSVSFGEERRFQFKHKKSKYLRHEIHLVHGAYLLMKGATQQCWLHQVPKETRPCEPRINLTFRTIIDRKPDDGPWGGRGR